jgi:hypothetical protein
MTNVLVCIFHKAKEKDLFIYCQELNDFFLTSSIHDSHNLGNYMVSVSSSL